MIGTTIGKYRILGQLGRGGAGVVYKAVDETLGREVAIKLLNPDLANTEIMDRFRAEARILARLNHPEIATLYELFRSDTDLLMVMEFVRGETLEQLSERLGPLPAERAAYLTDRILSALEHAHRNGIVHRDMKPANVMVTETGGVKIMDFGIARVRGAEHLTVEGSLMGTPAYMPPEQVLGEEVDGRADLYSVGVVFYRLLTGTLPFSAETPVAMLQKQIADPPAPLHVHREGLPDWCEAIVQRGLAKAPADRFQSAEEFRKALRSAAGIATSTDFARAVAPPRIEHISGTRTARLRVRGNDLAWTAAVVAALVLSAALLAYALWRRPVTEATMAAAPPREAPAAEVAPAAGERASATTPSARRRASDLGEETAPPLAVETKVLVGSGRRQRERPGRLVLADGTITITADVPEPLYAISYDDVQSISYSPGREPMWNSPRGPAPVVRFEGGRLGKFGIFIEKHWVSLRTDTPDRFIVMHFSDLGIKRALPALEARTGRTAHRILRPK